MVLTGKGRDHEGVKGLIRMETQTQADVDGGKVKIDDQNITVEGADSVTLYVSSGTNFINYHDISGNESKKASGYLSLALGRPYSQVLQEHIALYKEQFDRVRLDLGTSERAKLETVKRIELFNEGKDVSLAVLLFSMDVICLFLPPSREVSLPICKVYGIINWLLHGMENIPSILIRK